ncbi:MAG: 1-acyl-sn-glycerol-3-phosphate acyltransferase [Clostridia bacterium]|nr:1-acyl-sn-glycerol-3-phosphate acyltransferase [Clostridia bacterium]
MGCDDLSLYRKKILERINQYEREGKFDVDVEDDPPSKILMPNKVDYLNEKLSSRIISKIANKKAIDFFENQIKQGAFVIKNIKGIENYTSVKGGAVITCNHFSVYDHYIVFRAIRDYLGKNHYLYKVIREGNYTGFKGLFGLFFRHCNTLPLSSNPQTMIKFLKAVNELLKRGEKILIYPEQAMWWNYRKPRPFKIGAYKFVSSANVPIIPAFITMEDSDKKDGDGAFVQECTLWFMPPIYPKKELSAKENAEYLKEENFKAVKELYEKVYGKELKYGE